MSAPKNRPAPLPELQADKPTDEQEAPGTGVVMEQTDERELTADEAPTGRTAGGPVSPGTPYVIGDGTPEMIAVPAPALVVRALTSFHDALTRRDFRAGDTVPWDLERAVHYAARGLVRIEDL